MLPVTGGTDGLWLQPERVYYLLLIVYVSSNNASIGVFVQNTSTDLNMYPIYKWFIHGILS